MRACLSLLACAPRYGVAPPDPQDCDREDCTVDPGRRLPHVLGLSDGRRWTIPLPPPRTFAAARPTVPGLDARSAAILREIVEQYVETGEPVGSRTLSRRLPINLSPATIRNVMADLTEAGLLFAPHTSAGRLPTEQGLRLFVDGLLQFGELGRGGSRDDQRRARDRGPQPGGRRWPRRPACSPAFRPPPGSVLAPKARRRAAAHRVRAARLRPRARDPGDRGRAGGEPGDRDPARPAALGAAAGGQLPQRAARGPGAAGFAPGGGARRWRPTVRSSTCSRPRWCRPGSPPGSAKGAAARSSCADRRTCSRT